jgi:hypothetical protein
MCLIPDTPRFDGRTDVYDRTAVVTEPGIEARRSHVVPAEKVAIDAGPASVGGDRRHWGGKIAGVVVDDAIERASVT